LLAALFLGGSLTLGYAPFSQWWVIIVSLSGFIYLLSHAEKRHAFKLGFAFGLGWFGIGISWVHVSISDFGGLPLVGSLAIMTLLCSYLALFPASVFWAIKRFFDIRLWPLALPFIWLFIEWLRSWLLSGFPWLSVGYSQLDSPLNGWFAVIGEIGVSVLVVLISTVIACWLPHKNKFLAVFLVISGCLLSGFALNKYDWVVPSGNVAKIAMVQGNIAQAMRWTPEQDLPTMLKYKNMSEAHWDADVIIWPEAAVPKLEPAAGEYLHEMDKIAAAHQSGLITGIVNYNFETREAFNNLIGLGAKNAIDDADLTQPPGQYYYDHDNRYAKHHLLPIGEFIPFEDWLRGLAPIFDLPMSSFSRGAYQQQNIQAKGYYFAPALCFEIAFPNQIASNLYKKTNFIVTVSNDAWFGHSHGPAQHLEIAQVRAKEFGLPVLRATNNGITAFIDHHGHIQSRLPQFVEAVLEDNIKLVVGYTPYRNLSNFPIWICSFLSFIAALYFTKRQSQNI
jgi:apolipoprotein N-acyltransferase